MKSYRFHPAAEAEYAEAGDFYARIDIEIAGRFFDEIERLLGG